MTTQIVDVIDDIHNDNQARDAFHSITGYFYQFELTLLHILNDGTEEDAFGEQLPKANYKVETIEDYVKYITDGEQGFIRVAQIKHHSKGVSDSKYYDAVLWLYLNYLKFVQKGIEDTSYQAVIFQYDPKGQKDIKTVLVAALESYEKKKEKEAKEEEEGKKRQTPDVYDKIHLIGLDSEENREEFIKNSRFIITPSHVDVTHELKAKLYHLYGMIKESYTEEFLYGAAITKLIEDGKEGIELSFDSLSSYFHEVPSQMEDLYTQKIIDFVFTVAESNISDLEVELGETDAITEQYRRIYKDIINPFMKEKLTEESFRYSFLLSIAPKEIRRFQYPNSIEEYLVFVECSSFIEDFLSKLAKIIYSYQLEEIAGSDVVLDEWFDINDKAWLFRYPTETRGIGVLTGDINNKPFYASFRHFLQRFRQKELRPDVWYMGHTAFHLNASQNMNYELDVTLPREEREQFTFCDTNEDHFHIQCMGCLALNDFEMTHTVSNIFIDGCAVRGRNS